MKRYAKLVPLLKNPLAIKTPDDLNVDEAMKNLTKHMESVRVDGSFNLYVLDGGKESAYQLDLTGGKGSGKPHFAVRASRATVAAIAKGDLSPIDAYLTGKMEIHGDLELGKRIYARVASKGGETEP